METNQKIGFLVVSLKKILGTSHCKQRVNEVSNNDDFAISFEKKEFNLTFFDTPQNGGLLIF